jgi:putative hemolysin
MVNLSDDVKEVRRTILESAHSRLPVYEGTPEEMLGVLQAKDILNAYLSGETPDIRPLLRVAPIIPDTADALDVLEKIKASPVHMALIHDEYGHFEGVVTTADILEAIVGSFTTEGGPAEDAAVQREDGSWLISGSMPADEMAERLGISLPQAVTYHTAAGFALSRFGYLPKTGDHFFHAGWRFEVIDLDGRRIDKILVSRCAPMRRAGGT